MSMFSFSLLDSEKEYLKNLVAISIRTQLDGQEDAGIPEPPTLKLKSPLGAFVTLKIDGRLRGCIGNIQGAGELFRTIWNMARAAAFNDPRFPSLSREEFDKIEVEISVLSAVEPCPDINEIRVGRHGLVVQRGPRSGLLLPQVAAEWGWDSRKFLEQTCGKAGLKPDAWQKLGTNIFWFEAEVF